MYGGSGTDTLYGGDGNDYLDGGDGDHNYLYGGAGNDIFTMTWAVSATGHTLSRVGDFVTGEDRIDISAMGISDFETVMEFASNYSSPTHSGGSFELYYPANQVVSFSIENYAIENWKASDFIYDLTISDDVLSGSDRLFGGYGDDTITGTAAADMLFGEHGNDTLFGGAGNDQLFGGSGNDTLSGEAGDDVIKAGSEIDTVYGGYGDDFIYGDGGNDLLYGDEGTDTIYGGDGDDYLHGGLGDQNYLYGGAGNDIFTMDWTITASGHTISYAADFVSGQDYVDVSALGISDFDTIMAFANNYASETRSGGAFELYYPANQIVSFGIENYDIENWKASDFIYDLSVSDDVLNGSDRLFGGYGNDTLTGGGSADMIFGEHDDDLIYGDAGNDFLSGGSGNDVVEAGYQSDRSHFWIMKALGQLSLEMKA